LSHPFRKRAPKVTPLSPEAGRRQGRIVRTAQAALGSVEAVRAFLNSHNEALEARPIDLAIGSEAGLIAVEAAIASEGGRAGIDAPTVHRETSI
jgi:uncharacterized protein (DUF2384 family)